MAIPRKGNSYSRLIKKEVVVAPALDESDIEFKLLTEEEREELLKEVREEIRKEEVKKAKDSFKEKTRRAIRIQKGLEEEQVTMLIDPPGHAKDIRLDSRVFYHGYSYTVPYSVADTLYHVMDRAWRHEEEVGGANSNEYRKPRLTQVSGTGAIVNAPTAAPQVSTTALSAMSANRLQPKVNTTQTLGNRKA